MNLFCLFKGVLPYDTQHNKKVYKFRLILNNISRCFPIYLNFDFQLY